ncbi:1-phosphofructokinase family hexose kinase [Streptomyces sp. NPDC059524]|uniref:1-phosphofructokinase family hexose kinase n=1 Tax=Streptomyces sp. NPDC059524 TaxID=3346856 RepID=UPI0036A8C923
MNPASAERVLTLTMNPTIDMCWDVPRLADMGKNRARVRSVSPGGGGINVARGITRLGGAATALHTSGRELGRRLDRLLDEEGIDHVPIPIGGETREALVLLETETRRSHHIVPPGPRLDEAESRQCLDTLAGALSAERYVVASGSLPGGLSEDFYGAVARRVKDAGARLVLDTSGPAMRLGLAEGVFLFRCSRKEASYLLGREVRTFDDARAVNTQLLSAGSADITVTTIGELGALCSTREGHTEMRVPPLPAAPLSDAGAGDSMVAAIVTRMAAGDDPVRACALGVAVAAASVLTPGTQPFDMAVAESLLPDVSLTFRSDPRPRGL